MASKSVPTIYGGVQMRSRLEARWAAFFDLCGWEWKYEPRVLNGWLPDFELRLPSSGWTLVEVKPICWIGDPDPDWAHELDHPEIQKIHGHGVNVLVFGAYPAGEHFSYHGFPAIGMWQRTIKGRCKADLRVLDGVLDIFESPFAREAESPQAGLISLLWSETLSRTRSHDFNAEIKWRTVDGERRPFTAMKSASRYD